MILSLLGKFTNILLLFLASVTYNITGSIGCKIKNLFKCHDNCECKGGIGKSLIKFIIKNSDITITKFIQWLSMRPDLINNRLHSIFCDYKNNCNIHKFKFTEKIINNRIGKIEEIFEYFDKIPIASGSIAQVYRGKLRNRDLEVAIKVKHPDIDNSIKNYDIFINLLLKITKNIFNLNINVDIMEFYKGIMEQIDFISESENAILLKTSYTDSNIIIPDVIMAYNDIIVYEYIDSYDFDTYCVISRDNDRNKDIAKKFIASMYVPIYLNNIFHADIHDKNWGINIENKIVLYDFGFMREIDSNLLLKVLKVTSIYDPFSILFTLLIAEQHSFDINLEKISKYKMTSIKLSKYCSENYKMINTFINLFYDMNIKVCPSLLNFIVNSIIVEKYVIEYNLEDREKDGIITRKDFINNLIDGTKSIYNNNTKNYNIIVNKYIEILNFIENYEYIKKKILHISDELRKYVDISELMVNVIVSLINTILIHSSIFPTDIIDIMNYVEKKVHEPELHSRINKLGELFRKYDKNVYLLLKLQKNLLERAERYEIPEDILDDITIYNNFLTNIDEFFDQI